MKVFISSTYEDLETERKAAQRVTDRLRFTRFFGMEIFGARSKGTEAASLEEVSKCDLFVLILGGRYGSGITEKEYDRALELGLPCLVYFKCEASITDSERETDEAQQRRRAFRKRVDDNTRHTRYTFDTSSDLAVQLAADLIEEWGLRGEAKLKSKVINSQPLLERVRVDRFAGRTWLLDQVDGFIKKRGHGYLAIEAAAGLGKTSLSAHLVQTRGYIHHFVDSALGGPSVETGLRNIAAQIILSTAGINRIWQDRLEQDQPLQGHFDALLREAVVARARNGVQEPLIIVIDGLDQASAPEGMNPLGLPIHLPKGVVVIATLRPGTRLDAEPQPAIIPISADASENQGDMRTFLEAAAHWPKVAEARKEGTREGNAHAYSVEEFVSTLLEKSQGVWVYLHYVLTDIEDGDVASLPLESLPSGLANYYARFWEGWRDRERLHWDARDLPLLATLAALREPVSQSTLQTLAGVDRNANLSSLLDGPWRPFIYATGRAGGSRSYRFYHLSLNEFFSSAPPDTGELQYRQQFREEISAATISAHSRICDYFLGLWGGLDQQLPQLRDGKTRGEDDRYGFRWLASHLVAAHRLAELHRLLLLVWPGHAERAPRYGWFASRATDDLGDYIADVRLGLEVGLQNLEGGTSDPADGLSTVYHLALILASMRSLAGSVHPKILACMVSKGVWSREQAIAIVREMPNDAQMVAALVQLAADSASEQQRLELVEAAIAKIHGSTGLLRFTLLEGVLPLLPDERRTEELDLALGRLPELKLRFQLMCLAALAPSMADLQRHSLMDSLIDECRSEADFDLWALRPVAEMLDWMHGDTRQRALQMISRYIRQAPMKIVVAGWLGENVLLRLNEAEQRAVVETLLAGERNPTPLLEEIAGSLHPRVAESLCSRPSHADMSGNDGTGDIEDLLHQLETGRAPGNWRELEKIQERAISAVNNSTPTKILRRLIACASGISDDDDARAALSALSHGVPRARLDNLFAQLKERADADDIYEVSEPWTLWSRVAARIGRDALRQCADSLAAHIQAGNRGEDEIIAAAYVARTYSGEAARVWWDRFMDGLRWLRAHEFDNLITTVLCWSAGLIPRQLWAHIVELIAQMELEDECAYALYLAAPYLRDTAADKALAISQEMLDPESSLIASAGLFRRLIASEGSAAINAALRQPPSDQAAIVAYSNLIPLQVQEHRSKTVRLLIRLGKSGGVPPRYAFSPLFLAGPHLPAGERVALWRAAFQAQLLLPETAHWAFQQIMGASPAVRLDALRLAAESISNVSRPQAFMIIEALAPLFHLTGGEAPSSALYEAIESVRTCWP